MLALKYLKNRNTVPFMWLVRLAKHLGSSTKQKLENLRWRNENEVVVEEGDKRFFISDNEEIEVLFPELEHGKAVQLEGYVTRGTETSNSIGFRYTDHILTCHPKDGNIKRFKKCLFLRSKIFGTVSRADKFGGTKDPRPKIIFDDLKALGQPTEHLPFDENHNAEQ